MVLTCGKFLIYFSQLYCSFTHLQQKGIIMIFKTEAGLFPTASRQKQKPEETQISVSAPSEGRTKNRIASRAPAFTLVQRRAEVQRIQRELKRSRAHRELLQGLLEHLESTDVREKEKIKRVKRSLKRTKTRVAVLQEVLRRKKKQL